MIKQLGDGLVLRSLSEGVDTDRENLGAFYVEVFTDSNKADMSILQKWAADLMDDAHPTTTLDDIWVVVDTKKSDRIVSALLLIPQIWHYEGVPIPVGRVELVATDKDYRRRGLIRHLMHVAHERSKSLGHKMQAITGIPHYYRQFGYTMAVDLGGRSGMNLSAIPKLKEGQAPQFTLRPATDNDIPQLIAFETYHARQFLLSYARSADAWHYELNHRTSHHKLYIQMVVNAEGESVGYVALQAAYGAPLFVVACYVIGDKSSYLETFDDVMRGIKTFVQAYFADKPDMNPERIVFDSGHATTLDVMIRRTSSGSVRDSLYAWYIRVEDLADFMMTIAPVLEHRLEDSGANCYSGTLKIGFFNATGLIMQFEKGKLISAVQEPMSEDDDHASFPDHLFLNLLFGHRTMDELSYIMADAGANRDAWVLLEILFPSRRSWLVALL